MQLQKLEGTRQSAHLHHDVITGQQQAR